MNAPLRLAPSVCPHDCTSTCALEVEILDARTIGRVRGSKRNTYTSGVICEKVARYVSFGGLDAATRLRQSPRPNATALRGMRLSLKKPVAN